MSVWYCELNGSELGPLSSAQLIRHIREGRVTKLTPVRKDDSQWVPAIEINGLFAAAAKPVTRDVCPYCDHINPGKPPCECPGCNRTLNRVVRKSQPSPITESGEPNLDSPLYQPPKSIKGWVKKLFD